MEIFQRLNKKNDIEKFLVAQYPDLYNGKITENSATDIERGLQRVSQHFSSSITFEQLTANTEMYNLQSMLERVQAKFLELYACDLSDIPFFNFYNKFLSPFCSDESHSEYLYVDDLLFSANIAFTVIVMKWGKNKSDAIISGDCFEYLINLFQFVCIGRMVPDEGYNERLYEILENDMQIAQLAENCFWAQMTFMIAHELAHIYFARNQYLFRDGIEGEKSADAVAYDILLNLIDTEKDFYVFQNYTYLSPMICMHFFDLIYCTDKALNGKEIHCQTHPLPLERIDFLFSLYEPERHSFDSDGGNAVYAAVIDTVECFKEQLLIKLQKGKLDILMK